MAVTPSKEIAALFVDQRGPYWNRPDIDAWDEERDARKYAGDLPVVAHPPCERWGRYWGGGPSAKVKRVLGDDGGCFESALANVRRCGGVLEHPEASHAFKRFGLGTPPKEGGWIPPHSQPSGIGWTCCVEQGHYGHPARKATWLYYVSNTPRPISSGVSRPACASMKASTPRPSVMKLVLEGRHPSNGFPPCRTS